MNVLFLVGPRGSGKSLAAKLLASRHACCIVDTDKLVQDKTGKSIADIVAEKGWSAFREYEKNALREAATVLASPQKCAGPKCTEPGGFGVVATGGGIVLDASNRVFMRENGIVAYLTAPPDILVERLSRSRDTSGRPPLSGLSFEEEVRATMAARDPLYREAAHHLINAALGADTVARVLYETLIRNKGHL